MYFSANKQQISFEDYLALSAVVFNWGDSYDNKDWTRLRGIIAPTLHVDYTLVMDERWKWEAMPSEEFVKMISDDGFLGDPLIKTQHLLGATEWERISDTEVVGHHQLRAAHLRFTGPDRERVDRRGHSHASNVHFYKKVDGAWKFAGLQPTVLWNEYDFDKIFKGIKFENVESVDPNAPVSVPSDTATSALNGTAAPAMEKTAMTTTLVHA